MKSWDLHAVALSPHSPEVLESGEDGRAIALEIPAGGSLREHQVHEGAWVVVVSGEVAISNEDDQNHVTGGPGLMVKFEPGERHSIDAVSNARILLLLTPWPGDGHPGAMELDDKKTVRQRAADRRDG
ncbi:MAG TPA: cupin domain-containing protein [Solirubrobacteraceae bacterium]|jgi:quercetin dioxygenase-like cupin family protein|nr:cupin domain-containing protein [Solirubrobacteraceae bacterium]